MDKLVGPKVSVIREDTLHFHVHIIMLQVHTHVDELIISDTRRLSVKNQIQAILRNCLLLETVTPHAPESLILTDTHSQKTVSKT